MQFILLVVLLMVVSVGARDNARRRQRRYVVFPRNTQYEFFVTVSVPLPEPDNLVSVAWFYEAAYYAVANSTWFEPLLGDIQTAKSREKRAQKQQMEIITRSLFYTFIESMLEKHGYSGRACLLRSICETSTSHYSHNGLLGDLLHLILSPSTSQEEDDLKDFYYEAEYNGLDGECGSYTTSCFISPLDEISMFIDHEYI